ncbi:Uncharacterised protein [Actinomyces bovis]|uniref:DUF6571 domain-containing protein n=1 Tax=Actinomyces bovis TaxID=1658 RepID=A0ABY1VLT6_9ACTO|nr:DUF6571 family protein [Actinomyces bovis]SPT52778.1 Uncharacterised protein [Actinomyces bovis]VEG54799.1 Uncharacterised protein [Actinomyces israelii]
MAYVALDPDAVQKLIDGLNDYRDNAERERKSVVSCRDRQGWSVTLLYMPVTVVNALSVLDSRIDELKRRLAAAKAANEGGITTKTPEGWIQYYIPDGENDTADNATKYNQVDKVNKARRDAADLKNGSSSRSADQVYQDMATHEGDPVYATAFCKAYGVDSMLEAPADGGLDAASRQKMLWRFSRVWKDASDSAAYSLSSDIDQAVRAGSSGGRTTVMDAILTATDPATGEHIVFGTDFLVGLADKVEDIPAVSESPSDPYIGEGNQIRRRPGLLAGYTKDPLAAVLHAMGYNPQAANDYLAPPDPEGLAMDGAENRDDHWTPSHRALERMEMLRTRSWGRNAMTGLTAVFAAASSERATPAPGNDKDERASWATANGLNIIAAQDFPKTPEAARNTGTLLGNCAQEVLEVVHKENLTPCDKDDPSNLVPLDANGGDQEKIKHSLAKLLYNSSSSSNAAPMVTQGVTAYAAAKGSTHATSNPGHELAEISYYYDRAADVLTLMEAIDKNDSAAQQRYNGALAATQALSAVPVAGVGFTLINAGLTLSGPPTSRTGLYDNGPSGPAESLRAAYMNNMIAAGMVDPPNDASFYDDTKGKISISDDKTLQDFNSWMNSSGVSKDISNTLRKVGSSPCGSTYDTAEEFMKSNGGEDW